MTTYCEFIGGDFDRHLLRNTFYNKLLIVRVSQLKFKGLTASITPLLNSSLSEICPSTGPNFGLGP